MHQPHSALVLVLVLAGFLSSCVTQPRQFIITSSDSSANPTESRKLDLNRATAAELERLPGIGEVLAARIVEHRTKYGSFRRTEHLMLVRGMSEGKFRELSALVTAR